MWEGGKVERGNFSQKRLGKELNAKVRRARVKRVKNKKKV